MSTFTDLVNYTFGQVLLGGARHLGIFILIVLGYVFCKSMYLMFNDKKQFRLLTSQIGFHLFIYSLFLFILGYCVTVISRNVSEEHVISASIRLMHLDFIVFSTYPPIWFHTNQNPLYDKFYFFHFILVNIYAYLSIVMGAVSLSLIYFNPKSFYKFILGLLIVSMFSIPIWYLVPAVSPQELFLDDKFLFSIPEEFLYYLQLFIPQAEMVAEMQKYKDMWNSNNNGYFAITTFPSMHVGWSLIVMYYGSRLSKYLVLPLWGFFILTCISTVYLLQHYAVDSIAGIIIGIISIVVLEKYIKDTPLSITLINESMRDDTHALYRLSDKIATYITSIIYTKK